MESMQNYTSTNIFNTEMNYPAGDGICLGLIYAFKYLSQNALVSCVYNRVFGT